MEETTYREKIKTCPNCKTEMFLWRQKCPTCSFVFKDTETNEIASNSTTFTKHDSDKPKLFTYWIPSAHEAKARVMAHGASKYGNLNYQSCVDPYRFLDAAMRHLAKAFEDPSARDSETNELHITHAACCLDMVVYVVTKLNSEKV